MQWCVTRHASLKACWHCETIAHKRCTRDLHRRYSDAVVLEICLQQCGNDAVVGRHSVLHEHTRASAILEGSHLPGECQVSIWKNTLYGCEELRLNHSHSLLSCTGNPRAFWLFCSSACTFFAWDFRKPAESCNNDSKMTVITNVLNIEVSCHCMAFFALGQCASRGKTDVVLGAQTFHTLSCMRIMHMHSMVDGRD